LKQRFLAEANAHAGIKRANVGGWHSTPEVALRPEPCFQTAIQIIVDHTIDSMRLFAQSMGQQDIPPVRCGARAWAMIMRDGDYTILHYHGNAHWSASYYIDAGNADLAQHPESGLFVVTDPRGSIRPIPGIEEAQASQFTIRPQTGRLVIFPAWLPHHVHTYRGTQPHITLACNLTISLLPSASPPFTSQG
jgi:uncharacterized protein (TIGR02466 family)